ncbi:transcription factor IIIb subunit [Theileria orientalis]|uniref:B-related factor 1 n=1 Tax=Theileria orientalis TaxID=68886 RepID=A0A976M5P6_THEOR|nr:transcription factor IIIb subunit [Theileria orientalis]
MTQSVCNYCGSTKIEIYQHLGELLCQDCGAVLQENAVLEGIQYSETQTGSTALGQFIPTAGSRRLTLAYGSWQSREQVINRGYHNIQRIADYLRLSEQHVEAAKRIYLLAVQRNFTMGRNNLHVASCCLYTICRREKTPHLLIDFSDILQTPVKTIGQIFMKLVRMLHISVPNVDPSIFFERFATQLHLKDNIQKIIVTGNRIIQAMNRDWICTGRRPTGLCGAALVVAARFHGIHLSAEAVSSVVRISHPTILKRLSEFKETSTAHLKVSEFDKVDLESLPKLNLPPCLLSKLAAKKKALESCKKGDTGADSDSTCSDFDRLSCLNSGSNSPIDTININVANDILCTDEPTPTQIDSIARSIIESLTNYSDSPNGDTVTPERTTQNNYDKSDSTHKTLSSECGANEEELCELSSDDEDDVAVFSEMILPESEKRAKTLLWDEVTKDIMPQVWRRQMERKRREQLGQVVKKRKYCRRVYSDYPEAQDAVESARMALQRHAKGFISHINNDVFNSLLSQGS